MLKYSLLLLSVAFIAGCGGEAPPTTYKVSGNVTLDGEPVERAIITFLPDNPDNKLAFASSQPDGTYFMTTATSDGTSNGAMAGTYKVKVEKYETPDGGMSPYEGTSFDSPEDSEAEAGDGEAGDAAEEGGDAAGAESGDEAADSDEAPDTGRISLLPEKYASHTTSGLVCTVSEGENTFNIELVSAAESE